ncbi:MAG: YraN family protein [Chloroflexi bacterium]|nr:YraN family protein [Chloroflexota bacterium]
MSTLAQDRGAAAEDLVAARLEAAGWTPLGRNVRLGRDELDLVAIDPGPPAALVIVEVRWRGRRDFGLVEESFDRAKRARIRRAIGRLMASDRLANGRSLPHLPLRVDLVVVEPGLDATRPPRVRHHRAVLAGS